MQEAGCERYCAPSGSCGTAACGVRGCGLSSSEYELFAVMLTGRTLQSHRSLFGISSSQMTREDWKAVKGTFVKFDEVVEILRALPTSMLLIFRSGVSFSSILLCH